MACPTHNELNAYRTATLAVPDDYAEIDAHLHQCSACRAALQSQLAPAAPALVRRLEAEPGETFHLDEDLLHRYIDGKADETEQDLVETHVDECETCHADVMSLAAFRDEMLRFDWKRTPPLSFWERLQDGMMRARIGVTAWVRWAAGFYSSSSLSLRILLALILGIAWALAGGASGTRYFGIVGLSVFRLLAALALPLIFLAVVQTLARSEAKSQTASRMVKAIALNTCAALLIGLGISLLLRPGHAVAQDVLGNASATATGAFLQSPKSLLEPLVTNNTFVVIFMSVGFGLAFRSVRQEQMRAGQTAYRAVDDLLETAYRCLLKLLQWVVGLIPIGVFAATATIVSGAGLHVFDTLLSFVVSVLLALALQTVYYLARLRAGSWVRPRVFFTSLRSALLAAFSTASSAAAMPVTYERVRYKLGLRDESSSLGVLVGGSINRDGTALYEVMAVLFLTQLLGVSLSPSQLMVVLVMSAVASVAAPGIPMAGLATMTLVFQSLGLHDSVSIIAIVLPLDWLMDRCRTAVNVMGHVTVACLLDGKTPPARDTPSADTQYS